MPSLITVKADEKAVLLSNEKPVEFLGPGRHVVWINIWKRVEFFPAAQQKININNISVQLSQLDSDPFKQTRTRGNFVAEAQIDITFNYTFPDGNDLFATVKYAPAGSSSISDRVSNLIGEEIMAKVASFASKRTWSEALWIREKLQEDLNENIQEDDKLIINQLKLKNCRVKITRLNLPEVLGDIVKRKGRAEGLHIHVKTVRDIVDEFKDRFGLSRNTENLMFFLATSGEDIERIFRNAQMYNFMVAPAIKDLMDTLAEDDEEQKEKSVNKLLMEAEKHSSEVKNLLNMQNSEKRKETDSFEKLYSKMLRFGNLKQISRYIDSVAAENGPSNLLLCLNRRFLTGNETSEEKLSCSLIKILREADMNGKELHKFKKFLKEKAKKEAANEEIIDEMPDGWGKT